MQPFRDFRGLCWAKIAGFTRRQEARQSAPEVWSRRPSARRLLPDQRGVAAVEFGLLAMFMFVLMAGTIDISQRVIFQRDLKRFASSAALAMATCPQGGGSCSTDAIRAIKDRMAVVLPGVTISELRLASFYLENSKITMGPGVTTYFQGTEEADAKALLLREFDAGVFVSIKATHAPTFPSFAANWGLVSKEFSESKMQLSYRKVQ
ncbi:MULTISPECIES: TadE/TadG family type IV pilus assembly protein [unclassified Bosea (in: a-proteobacteria)]|uniref:TadE/TadG family type IV pilus assembly protein n=1 Tax=unclassified Bosea (in: a-proteobacteria) TaxID=2653178 RepID=UPI000F764BE8|nr:MULTISPECIES: TadE/TadG family type IV pilus assembly protein [unclassified Bosea (in: a-proteobacteria)]AZO78772.1 hypothetical protein BLM15_14920 [Bosea sp. Tri-49]RXT17440.1 hypothetical protein B5U98_25510 [Bosea sp. Tri-39]RXT40812.1 hypothetical protein B5U99_03380 [Bosea sp. Tri-54]